MSAAGTVSGRVGRCTDAATLGANSISGSHSVGVAVERPSSVVGSGTERTHMFANRAACNAGLANPVQSIHLDVVTQYVIHLQSSHGENIRS